MDRLWILLLLMYKIDGTSACQSGGGYWEPDPNVITTTTKKPRRNTTFDKKDPIDRNLYEAWGGWLPPKQVQDKWQGWLDQYKHKIENERKVTDKRGSDWPYRWQGIEGGHAGLPRPPWAYEPKNTGLPSFCYLPPEDGHCNETIQRYGFNPYIEECVEFTYSGCGGNQNNFLKKERCEEACRKTPVSGCDVESHIYVEDIIV